MALWIRQLEVKNFAGIESAAIEFKPGLNVCYGPNEIGKSTLVQAIRAALLLQDSSASARRFVDWQVDALPSVTLVFETEPQRIWRVRKTFGSGGSSYLEFSRDGQTFTQDARGREVDGKLQELLQWGIEAPGGARRRRGAPESFITTALIGDQSEVTAILSRSLDDDPDESGKKRLTNALQAIAEDPLFRAILKAAQASVDEAFTANGRRKNGRASPWVQVRDQLQTAKDRYRQVKELLEESESALARSQGVHQSLSEAQVHLQSTVESKRQIESDLKKTSAIEAANALLDEASSELARIQTLGKAGQDSEERLSAHSTELQVLADEKESINERVETASNLVEEIQAQVREFESGAAEQQRRLRENEIEKNLLSLASSQTLLETKLEQSGRINDVSKRISELDVEITQVNASLKEAGEVLVAARKAFEDDDRQLGLLGDKLAARRFVDAQKTLIATTTSLAAARSERTMGEKLQQEAADIRQEVADWNVPTAETLSGLRELETELRVAQEKLKVGLTVEVLPTSAVEVDISIDDNEKASTPIKPSGASFEASRELQLQIPGFGDIVVRGGTLDLHESAVKSQEIWNTEVGPVLSAAQCDKISDLGALCRRAEASLKQAQEMEAQAQASFARAENMDFVEQEQKVQEKELARHEASMKERFPDESDFLAFIETLDETDSDEASLGAETEELQPQMENRRGLASQLETQVSRDEGRLEGLQGERAALSRELADLIDGFDGEWNLVLAEAPKDLVGIQEERSTEQEKLKAIQSEATTEVDEARKALTSAQDIFEKSSGDAKEIEKKHGEKQAQVAQQEGELKIRREAAEVEDEVAAQEKVTSCKSALEDLPSPIHAVKEGDVDDRERDWLSAQTEVRRLELELGQAEGAIQQVGGQYIAEQEEQAKEAVEAVTEREREIEIDFGAWNMLRDTLRDAENEDGVHLGNALIEPVSKRMTALTEGRYGSVEIQPALSTTGIEFAGESRGYESLSLGTREQLATLMRLSIAEALGTFIVMDDQLTQSDSLRMNAIHEMLLKASEGIQVVVFTCRFGDYEFDDGEDFCAIDLVGVVNRGGVGIGNTG